MSAYPPTTFVAGVDPGLEGAVAFLDGTAGVTFVDVPTRTYSRGKRGVDARLLYDRLKLYPVPQLCLVEDVHAMPENSKASVFSFGKSTGKILAVLEVLGWPVQEAAPTDWKSVILKGTKKDKPAAVGFARSRWPSADVSRPSKAGPKDSHDRAEALCMAEFARRVVVGGEG